MNPYFVLFCIAGVLCSSELGFDIFAFTQQCLTKKLEEKTVDRFLFFICSLVWFLYTAKCQNVNVLVFSGATVGLICSTNIPPSEFEQHMYRSDPRPDTVSLMQLESRRAVPHASRYPDNSSPRHSPHPKPQPGHLIPQLDGCEVKNHCRLQDHAHFFIIFLFFDSRPGSCQPICGII